MGVKQELLQLQIMAMLLLSLLVSNALKRRFSLSSQVLYQSLWAIWDAQNRELSRHWGEVGLTILPRLLVLPSMQMKLRILRNRFVKLNLSEVSDPLSKSLTDLGEFSCSENDQDDDQDDE
jgi:hypothetical protein